jgi:hypothetical protein
MGKWLIPVEEIRKTTGKYGKNVRKKVSVLGTLRRKSMVVLGIVMVMNRQK